MRCFGYKKMNKTIINKANWLPNRFIFWKQIFVSLLSYMTLPFFKRKDGAILEFFRKNYYEKPDGLIFDGTSSDYYSQIERMFPLDSFKESLIIDLGCGQGHFYKWLINKKISVYQYTGIDIAIDEQDLDKNAKIYSGSITQLNQISLHRFENIRRFFIFSNSLCYATDEEVASAIAFCQEGDNIFIIEPYPHLFWDAHFDGIKPIYRTDSETIKLLTQHGFAILFTSIDYIPFEKYFLFGQVSYCIHAKKE